jgi:DNA-binding transcriptional regulator YiaG
MPARLKTPRSRNRVASRLAHSRALAATSPVAALRATLGMPRVKFARLLGRTERAVIDWETGKSRPQGLSQQRLRELQRLTDALQSLFDPKALGTWFESPNSALGNFSPLELIERGETDRLWRMIFEFQSGAHL